MKNASSAVLLFIVTMFHAETQVCADIYQYVDDQGVTCFTDSPTSRDAVRIMRDEEKNVARTTRHIPRHLQASGIAQRIGTTYKQPAVSQSSQATAPVSGRITSWTGLRHDPIDGSIRHHNGIDIAVPSGTPVKAVAGGTVVFSGSRPGYGNMIILDHSDGTITVYAHNSVNVLTEGTYADQGTVIALSGSTGRSTGPHLHFEAWKEGVNVTSSFIDTSSSSSTTSTSTSNDQPFFKLIGSDGSLYFTNMR